MRCLMWWVGVPLPFDFQPHSLCPKVRPRPPWTAPSPAFHCSRKPFWAPLTIAPPPPPPQCTALYLSCSDLISQKTDGLSSVGVFVSEPQPTPCQIPCPCLFQQPSPSNGKISSVESRKAQEKGGQSPGITAQGPPLPSPQGLLKPSFSGKLLKN